MKVTHTRKYGAKIVMYDRMKETREDVARHVGEDRGLVMVALNEDRRVLAGEQQTFKATTSALPCKADEVQSWR